MRSIYRNYNEYRLSKQEKVVAVLMLAIPAFAVGYVFYQNVLLAALLSLSGLLFPRFRQKQLIARQQQKLYVQFKQALGCLSSSLTVGKSVESAFRDAWDDLKLLYPDHGCFIVQEFGLICRKVETGEPIEQALLHFAQRSHLDDIRNFTDVFLTCKRTGGNLAQVMKRTATIIGEKLEIQQEIAVMVAQKKFEARVLLFAPIIIVGVLAFSSPDYMVPLYQGVGLLIMTGALLVLGLCYAATQKIMKIQV